MTNSSKTTKPNKSDRNWLMPPQTIVKQGDKDSPHKLSYWTDTKGKVNLYTKKQLATCNILMNLNLLLVRAIVLLDTLKTMDENAKIGSLIKQDYAKFDAKESTAFNHFITLMSATPDVTFGEFLRFLSTNTNPKELKKLGQKTINEVIKGKSSDVSIFYTSDRLKSE